MKNKLIILLFFATTWQANAQKDEYIHLLDTNKLWTEAMMTEFGDISIYEYHTGNCIVHNDTVYYEMYGFGTLPKYFREDTIEQKIYNSGSSYTDDQETLLYDFSLQVGDSMDGVNWPIKFYLDSIKNVNYLSVSRKTYYFHSDYMEFCPIWVEGIGSLAGVLRVDNKPNFEGAGQTDLNCLYHNNELIYQSYWASVYGCNFEILDQEPPVVDSIWFKPNIITSNDTVRLYVKATDDISGVRGCYTEIISPTGLIEHQQNILIHVVDDVYSADFVNCWDDTTPVDCNWTEIGTWHTSFILISDYEGNEQVYYFNYDASFDVNEIISVEKENIQEIIFSPNPVNNISKLTFPNVGNKTITLEIYNIFGKLVCSNKTNSTFFNLKKSDFTSGIYVYKLSTGTKIIYSNKIIIQ